MDSEAFEIARGLYNSKGIVFGQFTVYVDNSILHDKLNYARKFLRAYFSSSCHGLVEDRRAHDFNMSLVL